MLLVGSSGYAYPSSVEVINYSPIGSFDSGYFMGSSKNECEQGNIIDAVRRWIECMNIRRAPSAPVLFIANIHFDKMNANLGKLNEIKKLGNNWNSYGADPIPTAVIDFARNVLCALSEQEQPFVYPTARDSVQLDYESGSKYMEIEIFEDRVEAFVQNDAEDDVEMVLPLSVDQITEVVKRFVDI